MTSRKQQLKPRKWKCITSQKYKSEHANNRIDTKINNITCTVHYLYGRSVANETGIATIYYPSHYN